jgi:HSP20 family protein
MGLPTPYALQYGNLRAYRSDNFGEVSMAVWDPSLELERLRREISRIGSQPGMRPNPRIAFLPGRAARQYPLVNVHDDGESFHVEALAPGVDPGQLEITVLNNTLTIAGEKRGAADVAPDRLHRVERAAGRFHRSVELPAEVDPDRVEAQYRNGLLELTLPRAAAARPRRVIVQST